MRAIIDIETTGLNKFEDDINLIVVGIDHNKNGEIDTYKVISKDDPDMLSKVEAVYKHLKKNRATCIYQNGKFDVLFLEEKFDLKFPIHHDIMVMGTAYSLIDKHGLKDMAQKYLNVKDWDISTKAKKQLSNETVEYCKKDVYYTYKLFLYFKEKINKEQKKVYRKLLLPAYKAYLKIEHAGIYFDKESYTVTLKEYKNKETACLDKLKKRKNINWNSSKQVQEYLFKELKLPALKLSKKTGSPSADASTLRKLSAKGFEIADEILDYKFYYGANSKFLNKWLDFAKYDGRIHPSFNITNVITGRTSCSNPNLQQVPRNPELRNLFTAPKGKELIEVDYSQVELRIAADYASEQNMIEIYKNNGDIHTETAKTLTGGREPSKEERSRAKAINFGFIYGMTAKGFVHYAFDSYGMVFTQAEAELYRQKFFNKYYGLQNWYKRVEYECRRDFGVRNRFGRFRYIPEILDHNRYEQIKGLRKAINMPVQSTASDVLLSSVIELHRRKYKIVGTVHDSILIEVDKAEKHIPVIREIMQNPPLLDEFGIKFKVPLIADFSIGAWGNR